MSLVVALAGFVGMPLRVRLLLECFNGPFLLGCVSFPAVAALYMPPHECVYMLTLS